MISSRAEFGLTWKGFKIIRNLTWGSSWTSLRFEHASLHKDWSDRKLYGFYSLSISEKYLFDLMQVYANVFFKFIKL